ncbi:MAG TPA: hypothetical protein PLX02_14700 [Syntrophorhabdaceae bacterium]|nr:hypothetical protein [Syntrophorhabdaceae bacterium]HQM82856.1 hypothetical protein [Syntrophorhabdaceae bacterium]
MKKEIVSACKTFGIRFYTLSQIVDITNLPRRKVRNILWRLERQRVITRFSEKQLVKNDVGMSGKEIMYRNTKRLGMVERTTAENGWDKMWQVARAMRRFTRNDLIMICAQNKENVATFTKHYRKKGYLRPDKERGRDVCWTLIKDPGPKRPL